MVHSDFERMRMYTRGLLRLPRAEFETVIMIAVARHGSFSTIDPPVLPALKPQ